MKRRAFTLPELMVVIALVGVLAAISLPIYRRIAQGGKSVACLSNLRQLGAALALYSGEHNATLPTMNAGRADLAEEVPVVDTVLRPYAPGPSIFLCPGDAQGLGVKTGSSYFWNSALNGESVAALSFFHIADASKIPVLFDKDSFHPYETNKVNFLYADGHATRDLKLSTSR